MTYLTIKEAAEQLRMHPNRVYQLIQEQKLGAFQAGPGGTYRITQKQIDAFLIPVGADWKPKKQQA